VTHLREQEERAALHRADFAGLARLEAQDLVHQRQDLAAVLPGGEAVRVAEGLEVIVGRAAVGGAAHQLFRVLLEPPLVVDFGGQLGRDRISRLLDQLLKHGSCVSAGTWEIFDHW
jgi:hypothetical protein